MKSECVSCLSPEQRIQNTGGVNWLCVQAEDLRLVLKETGEMGLVLSSGRALGGVYTLIEIEVVRSKIKRDS